MRLGPMNRMIAALSFFSVVGCLGFAAPSGAQEQVSEQINFQTFQIFGIADALSLSLPAANLTGLGPGVATRIAATKKWFVLASASQLMDASSGFTGTLASSFRGSAYFSLGQPLGAYTRDVQWNGKPVVRIKHNGDTGWAIGAGSTANFLTGNRTVLAAPGMSANIFYQANLFGLTLFSELRYGIYSINGLNINGIGATLGIPISFPL